MDRATWFGKYRQQQAFLDANPCRVCFLGDSLTAFWATEGKGAWQLDLARFQPVNAGIAADEVQQVHYRARLLEFGRQPPKVFLLLAGTNNLSKQPPDSPEKVAAGVHSLAGTLRQKCPETKIVVLSILPNGHDPASPVRQAILEANAILAKPPDPGTYQFLDIQDRFLDASGQWKPGLTLDGTHLTAKGYDLLAQPIVKRLAELLEPGAR